MEDEIIYKKIRITHQRGNEKKSTKINKSNVE
jgi:hypothetical protein